MFVLPRITCHMHQSAQRILTSSETHISFQFPYLVSSCGYLNGTFHNQSQPGPSANIINLFLIDSYAITCVGFLHRKLNMEERK